MLKRKVERGTGEENGNVRPKSSLANRAEMRKINRGLFQLEICSPVVKVVAKTCPQGPHEKKPDLATEQKNNLWEKRRTRRRGSIRPGQGRQVPVHHGKT